MKEKFNEFSAHSIAFDSTLKQKFNYHIIMQKCMDHIWLPNHVVNVIHKYIYLYIYIISSHYKVNVFFWTETIPCSEWERGVDGLPQI